jgi:hypothetical protein
VTAIAADGSGVYAGGVSYAEHSLFVSRYDLGGQRVWNQAFGNPPRDGITAIAVGTDGVYAAGILNFAGFVRKYQFNGNLVWTNNDSLFRDDASVSANSGHVFASFDNGYSAHIKAYDTNGNSLWTASTGKSNVPIIPQTFSQGNNVYTIGPGGSSGTLLSYNSDGTLNWSENLTCSCAPTSLAADASEIYIVGAWSQGTGLAGTLVKYDLAGSLLWMRNFDSPDGTTVGTPRISLDTSGIYVAVTANSGGYLVRFDSNGNQVWSVGVPGPANAISARPDGVYVGGGDQNNPFTTASLSKYAQSSSLVLFGVNPPFSFGLVALLGGVVVLSLFWLRRLRKNRIRRPRSAVPYNPPKSSEDDSRWMRKPP